MKIAFCFDLDGTLTNEEILPQIAKHVELAEEIEILTKITMQGLLTFNKSFKLRVKLLSTIPISKVKDTVDGIHINAILQDFVQKNKEHTYIVTGNLDVWVRDFIDKNYGCNFFSSEADYNHEELLGVKTILNKRTAIEQLRPKYDIIVCIGDGMNDCAMFEMSDIGIAYGGVHEPVSSLIELSKYVCYEPVSLVNLLESLKIHHSNEN